MARLQGQAPARFNECSNWQRLSLTLSDVWRARRRCLEAEHSLFDDSEKNLLCFFSIMAASKRLMRLHERHGPCRKQQLGGQMGVGSLRSRPAISAISTCTIAASSSRMALARAFRASLSAMVCMNLGLCL